MALRKTRTKERINRYLSDLLGVVPLEFQGNLLLLVGADSLDASAVHVLLATLRAVINQPNVEGSGDDWIIAVQSTLTQICSEVTELSPREALQIVRRLFVDRWHLLTPEVLAEPDPEMGPDAAAFWSVDADFTNIARCMVDAISRGTSDTEVTSLQRLNRELLTRRYLSAAQNPELWALLKENKGAVAETWSVLHRLTLEVGDGYALLLDEQRQISQSKPYLIALSVAKDLGVGVPADQLSALIKTKQAELFPDDKSSQAYNVREAMKEFDLANFRGDNVVPTALMVRFDVKPV